MISYGLCILSHKSYVRFVISVQQYTVEMSYTFKDRSRTCIYFLLPQSIISSLNNNNTQYTCGKSIGTTDGAIPTLNVTRYHGNKPVIILSQSFSVSSLIVSIVVVRSFFAHKNTAICQ